MENHTLNICGFSLSLHTARIHEDFVHFLTPEYKLCEALNEAAHCFSPTLIY